MAFCNPLLLIHLLLFLKAGDEDLYPEYYRKSSDHIKGSNEETPDPFCIGHISGIFSHSKEKHMSASEIFLRVNKFYRPENTHKGFSAAHQLDLNMLYWSDEGSNFFYKGLKSLYSHVTPMKLTVFCFSLQI